MKLLLENWREFLAEEPNDDEAIEEVLGLGKDKWAEKEAEMDASEKKQPGADQVQITTVGELRQLLSQAITAKRTGQVKDFAKDFAQGAAVDMLASMVPGLAQAKTAYDIFQQTYKLPDERRTNTALDHLDVDDDVSAIVDDNVENAFLKQLGKDFEKFPDDTRLEDASVTKMLRNFLSKEFDKRTIIAPDLKEEQIDQKTAPTGSEKKAPADVETMIRYIEKIDTPAEYQVLLQKILLHAYQMKNTSGLKSFMARISRELPGLIKKIK